MSPPLIRWDVKLSCFGYWGFGGGYAQVKGYTYPDSGLYCNVCPRTDGCWRAGKERAAGIFPDMVAEFEGRMAKGKSPAVMEAWFKEFGIPDPYTVLTGGNIEDGMNVAAGGGPKDRGPHTLAWPLEVVTKP